MFKSVVGREQLRMTTGSQPKNRGMSNIADSERRFRLLVEGVVDYAIFMLDPRGIITNWNAGAQRIKGYNADEIIGQHFGIFYMPEDREAGLPAKALDTALRCGKHEAESWRIRKDGTRFLASVVIDPIYEHGELVGFAKITRDVTERLKAQQDLLDSERRFRLLVSNVTDYALYMLDPDGNVTSWNAGGEKIKGYAPDEIIGQHFSRFYTPEDQSAGRPQRALQIVRDTGRYEEEAWRVRKDGSFFWASVVIDAVKDEYGHLLGFAKITRDITERRESQIKFEKMRQQLAEAQKMDALGQLTGGVAHDFNNLLMIVTGHLQTLKKAVSDEPKVHRAIQAIELASQRGASLTRQLLTFSRRQRVKPEPIDVAQRIAAVRDVLASGLGSGTDLLIDISPGVWPINVDVGEFEIALVNLAINARDAAKKGGVISIQAGNVRLDDLNHQGDYVGVTVKDNGVGIPEDVLGKIFDPFFTTKPVGKGTGLGLSQVHGFVHQAGGTVKVSSTLGQGTAVTLYFPRALSNESAVEASEISAMPAKRSTVLLVEDNPDVASASAELLEQLGYNVRWVADAPSALKEIAKDDINLIVSDIVMPGPMDGLRLAEIVKQSHPKLPILLTTGYSRDAQDSPAAFPILRKPYQIHELSRALASLKQ